MCIFAFAAYQNVIVCPISFYIDILGGYGTHYQYIKNIPRFNWCVGDQAMDSVWNGDIFDNYSPFPSME